MLSTTCRISLLLMIVTTAAVLDQVESLSWSMMPTLPTLPSVRSFFWSSQLPAGNTDDLVRQHAAQTQNNIAQTQNNIAQAQSTVSDQFRKMKDSISSQVADIGQTIDNNNGPPGTKRTVSVSNDGVTEEIVSNYESPDGSRRGFAKTSMTTFGTWP